MKLTLEKDDGEVFIVEMNDEMFDDIKDYLGIMKECDDQGILP